MVQPDPLMPFRTLTSFIRSELAHEVVTLGDVDKKVLYFQRVVLLLITPVFFFFSVFMFSLYATKKFSRITTETPVAVFGLVLLVLVGLWDLILAIRLYPHFQKTEKGRNMQHKNLFISLPFFIAILSLSVFGWYWSLRAAPDPWQALGIYSAREVFFMSLWFCLFMIVQTRIYEGRLPCCGKIKQGCCGKDEVDTDAYFKMDN